MDWQNAREGRAQQALEIRAEFLLGLRARGIGDLPVLRAMETVPRELFVPHRLIDLANRDIALPIACGQTMPEPWLVARMMEALALRPDLRVLEIGAGSGYATAILARLAREIVALERFQSLAMAASARLERLLIRNAGIVWGDGLALTRHSGLFDRIIVHAALADVPAGIASALAEGGVLVCARPALADGRQPLVRMTRQGNAAQSPLRWQEAHICDCRLRPLIPGLSHGI